MTPTRTMMAKLLQDMGFEDAEPYEDGFRTIPSWAYDIAERILEAGWRKGAGK